MKCKFVTGMISIVCVLIMMTVTFQPVAANTAYDNMVIQPDITRDSDGNLHMVYSQLIKYYVSIGNAQVPKWQSEVFYKNNVGLSGHGNRWNSPIQISDSDADSSWPQVSVDSSTGLVYVSWTEEARNNNKFWYAGSSDNGISFTPQRYGAAAPWPVAPNQNMVANEGVLTFTWAPFKTLELVADIDGDMIPDFNDAEPMVYNTDNFAIELEPDVVATDNDLGVTIAIDYGGEDDTFPEVTSTTGDFAVSTGDYIEINLETDADFSAIIKMQYSDVPESLTADYLRLYRQEGDDWVVVTDWELGEFTGINADDGYVWAYVKHFSTFTMADASQVDGDTDGLADLTEDTEPSPDATITISQSNFNPKNSITGNPPSISVLTFPITAYNTYLAQKAVLTLSRTGTTTPINDLEIDVGNDGTIDWKSPTSFGVSLKIGAIRAAMNEYIFNHYTNSPSTSISIPFRFISSSTGSFNIDAAMILVEDVTTSNYLSDTSGDGLYDGWQDKNGNKIYERAGQDGIVGTSDDEISGERNGNFDPRLQNIVGSRGYVAWNEYEDGINEVNGNLAIQSLDIEFQGLGHKLMVERTYNSLNSNINGPFGYGWNFNYGEKLQFRTGFVDFISGDGSYYEFESLGDGTYASPPGTTLNLKQSTSTSPYELRNTDGSVKIFGMSGRLIDIQDKNENSLSLIYNADGQLIRVEDDAGLFLLFTYTSSRITRVEDPAGRANTYSYTDSGNLVLRTDAMGNEYLYSYPTITTSEMAHKISTVITPLGMYKDYQYSTSLPTKVSRCIVGEYNFITSQKTPRYTEYEATYSYPSHTISKDANGKETTNIFEQYGVPVTIKNPSGGTLIKEYDAKLNLVRETDALGKIWENTHDPLGNRIGQKDPTGHVSSTQFVNKVTIDNYISLPTKTVDKTGAETTYTYDIYDNPAAMTDPEGNIAEFDISANGLLLSQTQANGATTVYTYDTRGNTLTETDALGNIVSYTYDLINRKTSMIDARGGLTQYVYDDLGRTTMIIDPMDNVETYTFDAMGNTLTFTDRVGGVTTYDYDVFGRKVSETDALGNTAYYAYDWKGNLIQETDKRGFSTYYTYDESDRLVRVTDALGGFEQYTYDANGNQLEKFDKLGNRWWKYYDELGRVTHEFCPYGFAIQYQYDAEGRMTKKTDRMGYETVYEYDSRGNQVRVLGAEGSDTRYVYNEVGNLIRVSQIGQSIDDTSTWQYDYDLLGRKTSETTPLGFVYSWAYDEAGNMIEYTDANGQTTLYSYDALNRLTNLTLPGALLQGDYQVNITYLVTENERQEYNFPPIMVLYGLPIRMTPLPPRMHALEKEYDVLGRLVREMWAVTDIESFLVEDTNFYNITYQYDENGNIVEMTDQFDLVTTYIYDELNRLVALTDPDGDITTYQYDALGQLILTTYPTGTKIRQYYNAANLLTAIVNEKSTGEVISYFSYEYNLNANRVKMYEPVDSGIGYVITQYAYDAENRLTSVLYPDGTEIQYQYDRRNNMVSTTTIIDEVLETTAMTYDIENRLVQSGDKTFEYDNNGNQILGDTSYRYYSTFLDGYKINWLISVGTIGGGGGGDEQQSAGGEPVTMSSTVPAEPQDETTPATSYGYALDGRRVGKAGAVEMKYLYDGENVVYELWDQMTVRFTHPIGKSSSCGSCGSCGKTSGIFFTDHPISITIWDENGIATKYYYLYDGLGSVTELIDVNENVVNIYRYSPFGDALIREETVYNPHQFTGRQYDAESRLYHYRARAYSADIGRFMQQDPAGMVDGANMYAYVGNNPVNGVDPSGKMTYTDCNVLYNRCKAKATTAAAYYACVKNAKNQYNVDMAICNAFATVGGASTVLLTVVAVASAIPTVGIGTVLAGSAAATTGVLTYGEYTVCKTQAINDYNINVKTCGYTITQCILLYYICVAIVWLLHPWW